MISIEQHALNFMTERRLTAEQAATVLKIAKNDSRFNYLVGRWGEDVEELHPSQEGMLRIVLRNKVLTWMDKYNEGHTARALFTGAS